MPVLQNIGLLAQCLDEGDQGDIHLVQDASLVWIGDTIEWVGRRQDMPDEYVDEIIVDAGKQLVVPGLVDCHTHLAFGGWRADEFAERCQGISYQDIARRGGGILNSVAKTRAIGFHSLLERSAGFLENMRRLGVTTVEAKSGYGLDRENEIKQLRVYKELALQQPTRLVSTFLGAHTIPPEFAHRGDAYIDYLIEFLPEAAEYASFADVFVEAGAFSVQQAEKYLAAAGTMGMGLKIHADQLSLSGGASLAARMGAISADHLEFTDEAGIEAMVTAGTIAVALPIATLYLRNKPMNARNWIAKGARVAIATDFNPGSAPSYHLPLAMMLACTQSQMTPAQALKGATIYAASAVGMNEQVGSLEPGKKADFVLLNVATVEQWMYHFVPNAVSEVYIGGGKVV